MQVVSKLGSSETPTIPPNLTDEAEDFLKKTFAVDHTIRPTAADLLSHPWLAQADVEGLKTPIPPSIRISVHS
ncbi:ATP binding [Ceratobasidium sp. UAMH 11750]|nr:ATP binding [Ceratobasidium sp. UAMH 11750]